MPTSCPPTFPHRSSPLWRIYETGVLIVKPANYLFVSWLSLPRLHAPGPRPLASSLFFLLPPPSSLPPLPPRPRFAQIAPLTVTTDPWQRWKRIFVSNPVPQTPDELEQLFAAQSMRDVERPARPRAGREWGCKGAEESEEIGRFRTETIAATMRSVTDNDTSTAREQIQAAEARHAPSRKAGKGGKGETRERKQARRAYVHLAREGSVCSSAHRTQNSELPLLLTAVRPMHAWLSIAAW